MKSLTVCLEAPHLRNGSLKKLYLPVSVTLNDLDPLRMVVSPTSRAVTTPLVTLAINSLSDVQSVLFPGIL